MVSYEYKCEIWVTIDFLNEDIDPEQFKKDVASGMTTGDLIEKYGDVEFSYDPNSERMLTPKEDSDEATEQVWKDDKELLWDNAPNVKWSDNI